MRKRLVEILILSLLWGGCATPALAYLDPGSGSYFIQVLIGLAAGLLFALRSTLGRWIDSIRRVFQKPPRNRR